MPIIGQHEQKRFNKTRVPTELIGAVMLTYNRAGFLSATVESFRKTTDMRLYIYDDGSDTGDKLRELDAIEETYDNIVIYREPHRGLVRTWRKVFYDFAATIDLVNTGDEGIVLLEDDLLFAEGWDQTLLTMAKGCADKGLKPGAMTCFRCHDEPQAQIIDLNGVKAYQTMQHGFQINMVPLWVLGQNEFLDECVERSESGQHGIDIWFIGGMADKLGLTSFMSEESWVAHVGANRSVAEGQGYRSFKGVGYNLVHGLSSESGQLF
jgi:hypothetical protein